MKVIYLWHELFLNWRYIYKPMDWTGFKTSWITFHLVLDSPHISLSFKIDDNVHFGFPTSSVAFADTLRQSLWQRPSINKTSSADTTYFDFCLASLYLLHFPVSFIIKSVCISCLCLTLSSAEGNERNSKWAFLFVRRHLCATSAHTTAHESECVRRDVWASRVNWRWTLWCSSRALDADGEGRERKRRQRGSSGDKTRRINPLDEASALAPLCLSAIQRLQQDRMGTWKTD